MAQLLQLQGVAQACRPCEHRSERRAEWGEFTLSACRRLCSWSRAACFSLSSALVKDMPVLAREETALESVLALNQRTHTEKSHRTPVYRSLNTCIVKILPFLHINLKSTSIKLLKKAVTQWCTPTCWLLSSPSPFSPLERPSAAPEHRAGCWGPSVNVIQTLGFKS